MSSIIFITLLFLQFKHWLVDFVLQTDAQVRGKGIFGNVDGIKHSLQHGFLTALILFLIFGYIGLLIGLIDFVLHYLIDWTKMNYGNRDITNKLFWADLGLDQYAHQICYLLYVVWL